MYNNTSWYKNVPNILTIVRIITIPLILLTFYFEDIEFAHKLSAALFIFAGITDFLDGYIARKFDLQSNFGKMFDPIADKVLVGAILLMLVKFRKIQELPCILILTREFVIAGCREFLAELRVSLPVSSLAKIKTVIQMVALFVLLLGSKGSGIENLDLIGKVLLWLAAILTIVTGYSYLKAMAKYLNN
jgi:cardiolipin synthase